MQDNNRDPWITEEVAKERAKRSKEASENLQKIRERTIERKNKHTEILSKGLTEVFRQEKESKKNQMARKRAEEIKRIEEEFEKKHGLPTEKTEKINAAYFNLAKELAKEE